ncbi:MAG: hypothetical protein KC656_12575, partial [Myxococcales bacterium]|nr:hypothetical protein [Myxococcales bacterium]
AGLDVGAGRGAGAGAGLGAGFGAGREVGLDAGRELEPREPAGVLLGRWGLVLVLDELEELGARDRVDGVWAPARTAVPSFASAVEPATASEPVSRARARMRWTMMYSPHVGLSDALWFPCIRKRIATG